MDEILQAKIEDYARYFCKQDNNKRGHWIGYLVEGAAMQAMMDDMGKLFRQHIEEWIKENGQNT